MLSQNCIILLAIASCVQTFLYPRDSPTRNSKSLDGIWNFRLSPKNDQDVGFRDSWFLTPLSSSGSVIPMPVPASYNDITVNSNIRDFVGWAWYDRQFYVSQGWEKERVFLRFGSVHYTAIVYVNGQPAVTHSGGHLPFQAEVTELLSFTGTNLLTVAVNNTLTRYTVPQGTYRWKEESDKYPSGYSTLDINFDFFNYAGIHRPVILHTVPKAIRISDISTNTKVVEDLEQAIFTFTVDYKVNKGMSKSDVQCTVQLWDGDVLGDESFLCQDSRTIDNPKLWWPYLMSPTPGFMYTMTVILTSVKYGTDQYSLPVGLREITWGPSSLMVNHNKFYFRGFGKHEDSDIRGKGLDLSLVTRDYNLIKWLGANSYRTSHYPYAEEIMDAADQAGIVIIDEAPAVALDHFEKPLLDHHLEVMTELINRDKNHPSVFMWSVGNEPRSYRNTSGNYFKAVADHTRLLDPSRPVTLVCNAQYDQDHASQHFDVIAINRYYGWYSDPGHTELIHRQMVSDLHNWHEARQKPVMVTEYGADTVVGMHMLPSMQFTEEYQAELMEENFKAFDDARAEGWFIGEHIWNFADFMTKQEPRRVAGNKKGIFTRDRQPKMSAHILRKRYWQLAETIDGEFSRNISTHIK